MRLKHNYNLITLFIMMFSFTDCNKLVQIPEPIDTITTSETFATDAKARSAIAGIYGSMSSNLYVGFILSAIPALSSDELINFDGSNTFYNQCQTNTINPFIASDPFYSSVWVPLYSLIYKANAVIEGVQGTSTITAQTSDQLTGEAKFIRAFCNFYLVNLFGDVPLMTSTSWAATSLMARSPVSEVYRQIIADLKDAQSLLPGDYSVSGDERIRANKWAATALLARAYLYSGDFVNADAQASAVIANNTLYTIDISLDDVFLKNSLEAILQLQVPNQSPYATVDANQFIPPTRESSPNFYFTDQLLAAFETGDQRKVSWTDTTVFSGITYYYPHKYKVNQGEADNIIEYYMLLRLAEQYLIRAEAKARQNINLSDAINDLNAIRNRAGLAPLAQTLTQTEVLAAVAQERRIEFFSEWGNRWLDLKRTGQADVVLPAIKPQWQSYQQLYPIPLPELQTDPNLKQNPGY